MFLLIKYYLHTTYIITSPEQHFVLLWMLGGRIGCKTNLPCDDARPCLLFFVGGHGVRAINK